MNKKIKIISVFQELDSINELNKEDKKLLFEANKAAELAYAPYSNYFVGAALLLESGVIVKGNNQENVAFPSGLCAERVAVFYAGANYPNIKIKTIAITSKSKLFSVENPVSPCGGCRQVLAEYEARQKSDIRLILMGEKGKIHIIESVKTLLPLVFNENRLLKK